MTSVSTRVAAPVMGAAPAAAPRRLRPAPNGPGEFGTAQLVAIEIAAVAAGAAVLGGTPLAAGVGGLLAAGALATGLSRWGGRWAYETMALRSAMRRRRAQLLAPGFEIYGYDDRGTQLGIGQDRDGWFVVAAVGTAEELLGDRRHTVRLDRLLRLLDEGTARPSALQLVSQRTQAPVTVLGRGSAAAGSYRDLLAMTTGRQTGAATHLTWVAARLSAADAIEAAAERGGGMEGVNRALAAVAGRLGKALSAADVPYRMLDAASLAEAVHGACGLDGLRPGAPVAAEEHWRGWAAAGRAHVAFEVERWPAQAGTDTLPALTLAPAEQVVVSVVAAGRGGGLRLRTIVRVTTVPDRLRAAVAALQSCAGQLGVRLRPMNGLHQPGVYASAPTGGGML